MKHFFLNLPKNRNIQTYSFFEYRFILQIIMTLVICNEKLNEESFSSNNSSNFYHCCMGFPKLTIRFQLLLHFH